MKVARAQSFEVHRRWVATKRVSASVAASGRPELVKRLRKLDPYNCLVVPKLDALGRDARDILKTMQEVRARRSELYCLSISKDQLRKTQAFMATIEALADLERKTSAEKTRAQSPRRPENEGGSRVSAIPRSRPA